MLNGLGNPVRRDAAVRQPVVVPSLAFADQLQRRMADRHGLSMGLEWLTPQEFIHRAVGPGEASPWSQRRLVWHLLPHVADFTEALGVEDPSPRDRFALAAMLADRLDQYGHYRPEMIARWAAGARGKGQEAWQCDLWRRLRAETGHAHPAEALMRLREDAAARAAFAERYPKLFVVATGAVDPLLVALLGLLGEAGAEVAVHVLLPSLGYLGDLRRRGGLPAGTTDPELVSGGAGHPLLESMGRNAVGAFVLLGQLDEQYTHWPEAAEETEGDAGASALARLRDDIRALRPPTEAGDGPAEDASVRVHSCFGPRREMEVLRDELLRAFRDLPGLQPDEVHIVTPDLETYAPLVPAVFGNGGDALPVRLTERTAAGGDPVADAFAALLDMAVSGRFEAAEVMELVQKEVILAALGTEDGAAVRAWVRDSGLTHGLAGGEAGGTEGPRPGTSAFARDRLVAGRWFGAAGTAQYPDGKYVLPVGDPLGGDHALDMRLHDWLLALERTILEWGVPAAAAEWADRMEAACRSLLGGGEDTLLAVRRQVEFLRGIDCAESLDAGAVRDWLASEWEDTRRRGGVSGRIAFGRMKQLQNLPCRVLAVVGMQGTAFPAQNRAPVWDLLRADPRVWDRNPRVDDRQLFLDAILTPTDRLILTAGNRNPRTGKTEPFSACVDELLRTLALMGLEAPVVNHRLQPFVRGYFRGKDALPQSFDARHAAAAASIHAGGARTGQPFWTEDGDEEFHPPTLPEPGDGLQVVEAKELAAFWKDPAAYFLRALGVSLPREEPADTDYNRPPLALDGLQRWILHDEILRARIERSCPDEYVAQRMRADRGLPPECLGRSVWAAGTASAGPLAEAVLQAYGGEAEWEYKLSETISVTGTVGRTADGQLLVYRAGELKHARHYFDPWISALLAAACGEPAPMLLLDETKAADPAGLPPIPEEEARACLHDLVCGYFAGRERPLRFAPVTSDCIAKKLATGDEDAALAAGQTAWYKEDHGHGGGEGSGAAAQWVWRDADPFVKPQEWIHWAGTVALPLREWGGFR
ncbi:MAG: exodeoxyribonuclease V subunit gamma [Opitutales bacterium]|nr:exodeoxyribonuclease V subunit gamma [Opitutales bacterium]